MLTYGFCPGYNHVIVLLDPQIVPEDSCFRELPASSERSREVRSSGSVHLSGGSAARESSGRWPWDVSNRCLPSGANQDRFARDNQQQTSPKVCIAIIGPEGRVQGRHVRPWSGMGLIYAFPSFEMVHQVLQKIVQSSGIEVILNACSAGDSMGVPRTDGIGQAGSIPMFVEEQLLLTRDVTLAEDSVETRHYRQSTAGRLWRHFG